MSLSYIIHLANYSDGVMYLLMILLLVELTVIFDRDWYLRKAIHKDKETILTISGHGKLYRDDLKVLVEQSRGLPEESLLAMALRYYGMVQHYGSARGEGFSNCHDEAIFLTTPQGSAKVFHNPLIRLIHRRFGFTTT